MPSSIVKVTYWTNCCARPDWVGGGMCRSLHITSLTYSHPLFPKKCNPGLYTPASAISWALPSGAPLPTTHTHFSPLHPLHTLFGDTEEHTAPWVGGCTNTGPPNPRGRQI